MNYQHMSEQSLSSASEVGDPTSADSIPNYQATSAVTTSPPTTPQTPQTTVTITREGKQTPVVLAVHTSSTLNKPGDVHSNDPGDSSVVSVMTSQQAAERHSASYGQLQTTEEGAGLKHASSSNLPDFECPAGNRYKSHDTKVEQFRSSVRRVVDHLVFRAFTIILVLIDLGIVITSIAKYEAAPDKKNLDNALVLDLYRLDIVALTFSSYFMIEVFFRIFAETPTVFFRQVLEIIDALVVLISFTVVLVDFVIDKTDLEAVKVIGGIRLIRLVRFAMLIRVMVTQRKHLARATRLIVSENKRRYQIDGFDLDLCYVTDHMIAMSFPSQGIMGFYRNPIEEVSRFFGTKHEGHYRIYNCCSERSYDEEKFFNNCVVRILIDDHNVPTLKQMLDFAEDVQRWMNAHKDNVIAVHCKGGKGRTGTMVSVWLLHNRTFDKADDALEYFGSRRTDLSVDSKFQGVETPSQSRYVNYYEKMLTNYGGKIPEEVTVRPSKISVAGLRGIGDGDGKDLIMQILSNGDVVYEAKFGSNTNCTTVFERDTATISASLVNSPVLSGDVKVRFEATSNIPRAYDDCPWFFWFNTSFIEDNTLSLGREDLDNPHQKSAWKLYKGDFRVTLEFADSV